MSLGLPAGSMSVPLDQLSHPSEPSWEGDKMFNIYIYDYCNKRGFRKTARELLSEAEIPADSSPPIDARQGLLFEWWSVFWVLFTAKNNGSGPEDALVYTQHQLQQANLRSLRQGPPMGRMINGNSGPMQNGAPGPMPFPMPGPGPQSNGIPMPPGGPAPGGANPSQPQNFNQLVAGQRPGGPQHRGPNGMNPYHSPTMAHSPQNPGNNPGSNPPHPSQQLNQLGSSPHMPHMVPGRMLPPGSNLGAIPSTQTPPFSQLARSPSRPGTPGSGMLQPSPSMMHRQPPINPQEKQINNDLAHFPMQILNAAKQELGLGEKEIQACSYEEKSRILNSIKRNPANAASRKAGVAPQGPAGPSNPGQGITVAAQRPPGQPQLTQMPQQGPPRVVKRNSTSPPEEQTSLSSNENSPPDRKRPRRSSAGIEQVPGSQYPHPPQQLPNGGMMRPVPMGGGLMGNFQSHGPAGMVGNPAMNMPIPPSVGNTMAPAMGSQSVNAMMGMQYRPNVHMITKGTPPQGTLGATVGAGGTPTPGDPAFNPGQSQAGPFSGPQNNRVLQAKLTGMVPPLPSPAGGPPKEQPKDGNKPLGALNANHMDGSPQNQPLNPPQAGVQGMPAAPNNQGGTAPPTPSGTNSSVTVPSPSAVINGTPTISQAPQPTTESGLEMPLYDAPGMSDIVLDGLDFSHDEFTQWFQNLRHE